MEFLASSVLAAGLAIGIAACGCGVGMGLGLGGALTGISRNPEATGKIQVNMLIGLAMIESLAIYALVVSLILMYAHPGLKGALAAMGAH
jgi:F-type H+-transporting ATPase subunit c